MLEVELSTIDYLSSAVFMAERLVEPSKQLKRIIEKNPNWRR